jgi:hypothetical protein
VKILRIVQNFLGTSIKFESFETIPEFMKTGTVGNWKLMKTVLVFKNLSLRFRLRNISFGLYLDILYTEFLETSYSEFLKFKNLLGKLRSQKIKIIFEIFVEILDGSNFGKRCLLKRSFWNLF